MRRVPTPLLAPLSVLAIASAMAAPRSAEAATREDVARRWAPVVFQEVRDPVRDLYAAYDFDGDWNGQNNKQNAEGCQPPACTKLVATVYFTVVETATHWFVQYMPYHPIDFKATNGHEHDTESVLAVVAKDSGGTGRLQALEVRFHTEWLAYTNDPGVAGAAGVVRGPVHFEGTQPAVYSQMVGHGLCGGFSPPNRLFPDLSLTCDHNAQPRIEQGGVIYAPDLSPQMPVASETTTVRTGYAMVELLSSMWTHIKEIGPGKAFKNAIDFDGDRCSFLSCPKQFGGAFNGDDGSSPGFPWAQEGGAGAAKTGSQFFDPAYAMSKRLAFPQPFATDYCFNPYVSVADACATAAPDPVPAPTPQPATGATTPPVGEAQQGNAPVARAGEGGCSFAAVGRVMDARDMGAFALACGLAIAWTKRRRRAFTATECSTRGGTANPAPLPAPRG